jgi:enoyl-CoA hydratase/carnithine racemase
LEDLGQIHTRLGGWVPRPNFDDYAEKYREHVLLTREQGIVEFRIHHEGGPAVLSFPARHAWAEALKEVGGDPENELLIITGTGNMWVEGIDAESFAKINRSTGDVVYEYIYQDTIKLLENLIFNVDIPTIGAINGPGFHNEFALASDITICSETTVFADMHHALGLVPGDGFGLTLQALMGVKRSAYAMYTCHEIDAAKALELGLVNEVLPPDQVLSRAWEIAEEIMKAPRITRRLTHSIVSRPWRQRLVADHGLHLLAEMSWPGAVALYEADGAGFAPLDGQDGATIPGSDQPFLAKD